MLSCCELTVYLCMQTCSKQYKNAYEMETHMSSYDHHHRKVGTAQLAVS